MAGDNLYWVQIFNGVTQQWENAYGYAHLTDAVGHVNEARVGGGYYRVCHGEEV